MPLPKKLVGGYTITRHLLDLAVEIEEMKELVARFSDPGRPPAKEKEWSQFLSTQLRLMHQLNRAGKDVYSCLDIARERGVIGSIDVQTARRELLRRVQQLAAELEESLDDP